MLFTCDQRTADAIKDVKLFRKRRIDGPICPLSVAYDRDSLIDFRNSLRERYGDNIELYHDLITNIVQVNYDFSSCAKMSIITLIHPITKEAWFSRDYHMDMFARIFKPLKSSKKWGSKRFETLIYENN